MDKTTPPEIRWGIYVWVHVPSARTYVGQTGPTTGFVRRRREHRTALNNGTHHSRYFQRAWNKYGESEFEWFVLEDMTGCYDDDLITAREQHWMDTTLSVLNASPTAGSTRNYKHTEESCVRMSESALRRWESPESEDDRARLRELAKVMHTPESRKKAGDAHRGIPRPPEVCDKISAGNLGKPKAPEHVAKSAEAHRALYAENPELRARQSDSVRALWEDPEYRARMVAARKKSEPRPRGPDGRFLPVE